MLKIIELIKQRLPILSSVWTDFKSARYFEKRYGALNREALRRFYGAGPVRVLSGPFHGMAYLSAIGWGSMSPKWLGTYELELTPAIEFILQAKPSLIIDLGAAEGYYAVGLARALPAAQIHAFDISLRARRLLRQMISLNGCQNITTHGLCDHQALTGLLSRGERSLVLCDIEGAELLLLEPRAVPALSHADILVECHHVGAASPAQTAQTIAGRFSSSHHIELIESRARQPRDFASLPPAPEQLDPDWLQNASHEGRGEAQCWLWMRARTNSA
jgi:hypothetical protein